MRPDEMQRTVKRYLEAYELAVRGTDVSVNEIAPPMMLREVTEARRSETEALKLLILAELFAGMQEDSDALAAWMYECLHAGEIVERGAAEDDW